MKQLAELFQLTYWEIEKHIPFIESHGQPKVGELFQVKVTLGKGVPHPNTVDHHIRWISVYFQPEGEELPYQIGQFGFSAYEEPAEEGSRNSMYAHYGISISLKTGKPGVIYATALCNIHGLSRSENEIRVS